MILLLATALVISATATVFDQPQISESTHLLPGAAASSHIKSRSPQLPFAQPVNPYNLYRSEPAPMGISDYGIGPGGSPYSYSTTSFLGNINIKNLHTYNASLNSSAKVLTFQLNINFVFYVGSTKYVYWVQNVADFNTFQTENHSIPLPLVFQQNSRTEAMRTTLHLEIPITHMEVSAFRARTLLSM